MPKADKTASKKIKKTDAKKQIAELIEQLAAAEDAKLRALAEAQNIQKRRQEERVQLPNLGKIQVIEALLPVLDNLELAMDNQPDKLDDWGKGVQAILNSLEKQLDSLDVSRIDQTGGKVDVNLHEVISIDQTQPKDTVCIIAQTGYKLGEIVIRPAKVVAGGKRTLLAE